MKGAAARALILTDGSPLVGQPTTHNATHLTWEQCQANLVHIGIIHSTLGLPHATDRTTAIRREGGSKAQKRINIFLNISASQRQTTAGAEERKKSHLVVVRT